MVVYDERTVLISELGATTVGATTALDALGGTALGGTCCLEHSSKVVVVDRLEADSR